ncbi:MAG: DUF1850 domain-containing protein [Deltaproteobacteria bacterium]|jgi:hypothetical protein|nr:DUF1850 domain-containing protein [Deltaproteobacteria bacterium]
MHRTSAALRFARRAGGRRAGRFSVFRALALLWLLFAIAGCARPVPDGGFYLRIYDWKTGAVYAEAPARAGSRLFFGWIHSQENIPWNEYYHVDASRSLILDAITFPAFGAGIPESKGRVCRIQDGLIYMEEIDQVFTELVWLNSHTATRDIVLDGAHVARGDELPQHTRLRLVIEKR